ncbi:hypothetical protein CF168_06750 [Shewanella bicestrii]|uniref:Uncharacterized protein n=1 Tax=Shewanella bicestrii TaxID=2018305 RepID=A0A220UK94_9GAMM|nr:hypothetical protein CF168_06750 [Shewanella bicestrii]
MIEDVVSAGIAGFRMKRTSLRIKRYWMQEVSSKRISIRVNSLYYGEERIQQDAIGMSHWM